MYVYIIFTYSVNYSYFLASVERDVQREKRMKINVHTNSQAFSITCP